MSFWIKAGADTTDQLLKQDRDKAINSDIAPTDYSQPYVAEGKLNIPGDILILTNIRDLLQQVHCYADITPDETEQSVLRIFLSDIHGNTL